MDLVEFLRARLDEDEAAARAATPGPWSASGRWVWAKSRPDAVFGIDGDPADAQFAARHDPARVLREVEAKRRIVDEHYRWSDGRDGCVPCDAVFEWCPTLLAFAPIWSDHPDYDPEWKP